MPHPLLSLLGDRPGAPLADQLARGGEWLVDELSDLAARWQRRLAWQAAAGGFALIALLMAGMAVLLAAQPAQANAALPMAFWAVPGGAGVLAGLCLLAAGPAPRGPNLAQLRAQLAEAMAEAPADGSRAAGASPDGLALASALAAGAGRQALQPFAQQHPIVLVALAAAGGALLVQARPWRLLDGPTLTRLGTSLGSRWLEREGGALVEALLAAVPPKQP